MGGSSLFLSTLTTPLSEFVGVGALASGAWGAELGKHLVIGEPGTEFRISQNSSIVYNGRVLETFLCS